MRSRKDPSRAVVLSAVMLCLSMAGCTKSPDNGGGAEGSSAQQGGESLPAASGQTLNIAFDSDPNPVRSGDNTLTITVKQPDGTPIDDATVSAQFYMPAMPSMSMPEMRSDFSFSPKGDGRYEGAGQLVMGGTWNVTVNVQPVNGPLETRTFSVIASGG